MSRTVILGAGIAGLELGRRLKEKGLDFVLLEKEAVAGGLCRTNVTGDYRWDLGVHAMYSRSPEIMDRFRRMPLDYQGSVRDVKVLRSDGGRVRYLVNYPFENGVHELPLAPKWECILGYLAARARPRPASNLQEWIDRGLGFGIAKHFMTPYNRKIWSCGLERVSKELVSSKIEPTPALTFLKGALLGGTVGRAYQSRFLLPRRGIQELPNHLASGIRDHIRLSSPVERLERRPGGWSVTAGGQTYEASRIVSTIPLPELLRMLDLEGVPKSCPELAWNDTHFVMVGLKPGRYFRHIQRCHWVFFPGDEIFYRVTLMHNFSSLLPPALIAEVTVKPETAGWDSARIRGRVVEDLMRSGIVAAEGDLAVTDDRRIAYTYPIPTVGLRPARDAIRAKLQAHGILLVGRNGNWDYVNIDGVLLKVGELAGAQFNA